MPARESAQIARKVFALSAAFAIPETCELAHQVVMISFIPRFEPIERHVRREAGSFNLNIERNLFARCDASPGRSRQRWLDHIRQ